MVTAEPTEPPGCPEDFIRDSFYNEDQKILCGATVNVQNA